MTLAVETHPTRHPCTDCPWRVDSPRGHWAPQHFHDIARNCQNDGMDLMLCHKANALPESERRRLICVGWARVVGFNAIGVRMAAVQGLISREDIEASGGPRLFKSFGAMLWAHLRPRRAKREGRFA